MEEHIKMASDCRVFALDELKDALARMEAQGHWTKAIVVIWSYKFNQ